LKGLKMSEAGANIMLAWMAGVLLGIGVAQGAFELIAGGSALTVMTLLYYHRFVKPKEND